MDVFRLHEEPKRKLSTSPKRLMLLLSMQMLCILGSSDFVSFNQASDSYSSIRTVPEVLSFENDSELNYFTFPNTSKLTRSSKHYKDGFHSLVWQWGPGDKLNLNLGRRLTGKRAGLKFWIYQDESLGSNLSVSLIDSTLPVTEQVILKFNFSLNFTGWRASWVALLEAKWVLEPCGYDKIQFAAPFIKNTPRAVLMDLLCFVRDVVFPSRDTIVPPINGDIYDITSTWQQTYRWSLVVPPKVNATAPLTTKETKQLSDLYLIEKRLLNWFANESVSPMEFKGDVLKRWKYLVVYGFQIARRYYKYLNITVDKDGIIRGAPLFVRRSQFGNPLNQTVGGNKKLGEVTFKVLFPLTLEYYFSTRTRTIQNTIGKELANINSPFRREAAVRRITMRDLEYSEILLSELQKFSTHLTPVLFRQCLMKLNEKKLDKIMLILRYVTDQGWVEGSAMGSLDHEMNRAGNGYMNSMFLLRGEILRLKRLDDVLDTMKWYNNFGEIYQKNFEYSGTTADRLRTMMLYRLQIILMSRNDTIYEKRAKLRDMKAYVRWCNNALLSHPAFRSMFKPDSSCFHHLGIYGSAYTPEALTKSSNIWHFLRGTSFALDNTSKTNIRRSLLFFERLVPKYSVPNSISGRFPGYSRATLIKMLPAFAFFSIRPQYLSDSGKLQEIVLSNDTEMIRAFLRLYDRSYDKVQTYIGQTLDRKEQYLASIGSLQVLQAVYRKAKEAQIQPTTSQTGHWVNNFAALSTHRRRHWVVTVKGFSRYVWDFESSANQNVYGMYQSHGALQISNSEDSLSAYDAEHGWDWTRVPGTTAIKLSLNEMIKEITERNYQQSKLVGGVVLTSKDPHLANGAFAMEFRRPEYCSTNETSEEFNSVRGKRSENIYVKQKIGFNFKKSVFFYDSLIVCLGSDILVRNSGQKRTQTTLFQDKYTSTISSIYINGKTKWLSKDYFRLLSDSAAILDTNGNGYYLPKNSSAKVTIALQTSKTNDGKHVSKARYATVWLDHGINPFSASYEYAIIVASDVEDIEAFRKDQTSGSPRYEVLHKNSAAHVVRFPGAGDRNNPSITYGYAFFKESAKLSEGPIQSVTAQCIIMVDIDMPDFSQINVSISSPDLNYNTTKVLNTIADNGINEFFYMRSQPVNISVYVIKSVALQKVLINGKAVAKSQNGHYAAVKPYEPENQTVNGSVIDFINLINGESVEVFLTISDVIV